MAKPLRKAKKPPKIADPKPLHVRIGTPQSFGPWQEYRTEADAKRAMRATLADWEPWCQRFNRAGLEVIADTLGAIDTITFTSEPKSLTCCFDDYTGMTWAAEWKRAF